MAFEVMITEAAESHVAWLSVRERRLLEAAIQARLVQQPTTPTKAIKKLRPNSCADYELRVGDLRVLYNVEVNAVVLLVVGRKAGNKLIVKGVEYHEHEDNPTEPPGAGSAGDTE